MSERRSQYRDYCGCCGRESRRSEGYNGWWCKDCQSHVLRGRRDGEATYFAQHGMPCPYQVMAPGLALNPDAVREELHTALLKARKARIVLRAALKELTSPGLIYTRDGKPSDELVAALARADKALSNTDCA